MVPLPFLWAVGMQACSPRGGHTMPAETFPITSLALIPGVRECGAHPAPTVRLCSRQ